MRRAVFAAALVGLFALVALAQTSGKDEADEPDASADAAAAKAKALTPNSGGTLILGPTESAPLAKPKEAVVPARVIFSSLATPAPMAARAIGSYSRGCLAGAVPVPIDGETWQVMRVSRNRNWGHPTLIAIVERLAEDAAAKDGWQGLLVGDVSQPRGGPMLSDHASHQIGLDVDIWLTPMPDHRLTEAERDQMPFTSMLAKDGVHVDPEIFTPYHAAVILRAASYPEVERIFVHPGIKKAMCEDQTVDRTAYHKIRPLWGHDDHFHVRIACPRGSSGCRPQPITSDDEGCGGDLDTWLARVRPKPPTPAVLVPITSAAAPAAAPAAAQALAHGGISLNELPAECRAVVSAGIHGDAGSLRGQKKTRSAHSTR